MCNLKVCSVLFVLLTSASISSAWFSKLNKIFTTKGFIESLGRKNERLLESIASGVQIAMDHCKSEFKWNRWNCPHTTFSRGNPMTITREVAYSQAILAAGIVHSVTRNCSQGQIKGCGCNPTLRGRFDGMSEFAGIVYNPDDYDKKELEEMKINWSWGGCSDDVEYGSTVAKSLLDDMQEGQDLPAFAYLHNNLSGRKAIQKGMVKKCKCHGVSGACNVQTCWMQMPTFRQVAKTLKESYDKAIQIDFEDNHGIALGNSVTQRFSRQTRLDTKELVYIAESPNYCVHNKTVGWMGVKGRICAQANLNSTTTEDAESCKDLCEFCGNKVRKLKKNVEKQCKCTFNWCCEVKCETCTDVIEEYVCE